MSVFIFKDFLCHMCTINYFGIGSILYWVIIVKPGIIESGKGGKATAKVQTLESWIPVEHFRYHGTLGTFTFLDTDHSTSMVLGHIPWYSLK